MALSLSISLGDFSLGFFFGSFLGQFLTSTFYRRLDAPAAKKGWPKRPPKPVSGSGIAVLEGPA
jgi:hypothetical protein